MSTLNVGSITASSIASGNITTTGTVTTAAGFTLPSFTTATRPGSPAVGQMIYNTTVARVEIWSGSAWTIVGIPVTQYIVQCWGAGGGGGTAGGWSHGSAGGGGGYTYGEVFGIPSGTTMRVIVGQGGAVNGNSVGYGGGGQANRTGSDNRYGSNGGGLSGLFLTTYSQANAILIAGGGGGGGSSRAQVGNAGGGGGGLVGQDGRSPYDGKDIYRGRGGGGVAPDQAASDSDNTNQPGAALLGGTCRVNGYGGAGGGGYFGGSAGGYSESNTMGGGAGGSGYINLTYVRNGRTHQGEHRMGAGAQELGHPGGNIGNGGPNSTVGFNGAVRITNVITGAVTAYAYTGSDQTFTV